MNNPNGHIDDYPDDEIASDNQWYHDEPDWEEDDSDDEIVDPEISAANWCDCGLPREACHCDDWDESNPQMGPKIVGHSWEDERGSPF